MTGDFLSIWICFNDAMLLLPDIIYLQPYPILYPNLPQPGPQALENIRIFVFFNIIPNR